jgi:transcriptional regulator with XRE-family HTH domain
MRPEDKGNVALGEAIRELRMEVGLTQEELAHRTGITVSQVSRIERGQVDPRWTTVKRIAHGLGLRLTELADKADAYRRAN